MTRRRIKLEEEAISEILVADTNCGSGAQASDSEEYFEEEDNDDFIIIMIIMIIIISSSSSSSSTTTTTTTTSLSRIQNRLQQDYQPVDLLKEGTQIIILLSVQQKVWKKWGSTHQQRQLTTVFVDVFHRNLSSTGWTDQRVLPATLRQTSQT